MDQRRFISFLMLSIAALMLANIIFPPPAPQPKAVPAAGAKDDAPADAPQPPLAVADPAAPAKAPLPQVADVAQPTKFVTLGSLDSSTGYRMLVTMSSTGASVRRAEMTSRRYLDQHDWSGYLGELELITADGGAKVQVVGAGTPAAKAGLQPGDVIVGVAASAEKTVTTAADVTTILAGTNPEQQITLQVKRGESPPRPFVATLIRRPFAVVRPEIDNYRMRGAEPPPDFVDIPSFLVSLRQIGDKPLEKADAEPLAKVLEQGNWEVADQDLSSVTFRRPLPELKLEVTKRYSLLPAPAEHIKDVNYPAYDIQLDVEFRNTSDAPHAGLAYRLEGPTGMPLEGWWYAHKISQKRWFAAAGLRDVVVRFDGSPVKQIDCPQIAEGGVEEMGQGRALAFAGVDGVYFSAVIIPIKKLSDVWFDTTEAVLAGQTMEVLADGTKERRPKLDPRTPQTFANVTCRMLRKPLELAAGATHRDSFQIFLGPKRPDLLFNYQAGGNPEYSLKDIIYYGWPMFAAVAKAMLWVLHSFYSFVGNYGIAIIMLTVVVRGTLFPLSYKQTQSMARLQALKPEMDRITEKYKSDMQKRSQAIQELYRKHKINPLGGCLPVFLQLPIFIGLYRALAIDVELRQSPLFSSAIRWCSNLAAPDMLWNWSGIMPDFVTTSFLNLGPYLNVLPLITIALFLVTQKMAMPAPTNEQAAMQQKMMKYMTVFMGFMFYKVASGLCLYFIASSLWGIGERKLLPKAQSASEAAAGGTSGSAPGASGKRADGGSGSKPGSNGSAGSKRPPKAKRKK